MNIIECKNTEQISGTFPIIAQHYDFSEAQYLAHIEEMMASDYRLFGMFDDTQCLAVIGFRVGRRLYCGKYLHIDNLIVGHEHRRKNIAEELLHFAKEQARELDCDSFLADTYVENYPAHKLFMKNGLHIRGHHMREIL